MDNIINNGETLRGPSVIKLFDGREIKFDLTTRCDVTVDYYSGGSVIIEGIFSEETRSNGFEVLQHKGEKEMDEQLYKVELPDPESYQKQTRKALYRREDGAVIISNVGNNSWNSEDVMLTEEEIKYNHSYLWEFAEKVSPQKYIVPVKGIFRDGSQVYLKSLNTRDSNTIDWSPMKYMLDTIKGYSLTEAEIKDINEDFFKYAIKVEDWIKKNE